jgi:hypothetical protein
MGLIASSGRFWPEAKSTSLRLHEQGSQYKPARRISCLTHAQGLMSERSNRLPRTLAFSKADNADTLIRTGSADFIMATGQACYDEYMTAFVTVSSGQTHLKKVYKLEA